MSHDHGFQGFGHHICMWETPSVSQSAAEINYEALKLQNQSNLEELQRLRALLDANNIKWTKSASPFTLKSVHKKLRQSTLSFTKSISSNTNKTMPFLPLEIVVKIMSHAVTYPHPIIDPFWKLQRENLTRREQKGATLHLNFLLTCRAFKVDGTQMLIANNTFIFTQVQALQNFANIALDYRNTLDNVTLRIVGKYYDTVGRKRTLRGDLAYHDDLEAPTVWISPRPSGSGKDNGVQAYCWEQVSAFLQALILRSPKGQLTRLLPALKTMRIDLVNFCEHLPSIGTTFISVLRWHIGHLVEELVITGLANDEVTGDEVRYMEFLVKDGGLIFAAPPTFVSVVHSKDRQHLKNLASDDDNTMVKIARPNASPLLKLKNQTHPEGGSPPKSIHPPGSTIWKWTTDSLNDQEKRWIEFHVGCGLPATLCGELKFNYETDDEDNEDVDVEFGHEFDSDLAGWEDAEGSGELIDSDVD